MATPVPFYPGYAPPAPRNQPEPRRQPGAPGSGVPGGVEPAINDAPPIGGGYITPSAPAPSPTAPGNQYQADGSVDPKSVADPLGVLIQQQLQQTFALPPTSASPNEDRLQVVQKRVQDLEGLQAVRNDSSKFQNLGLLEKKLREMGLWNGNHPGLSYEDSLNRAADEAEAQLSSLNREVSDLKTNIAGDRAAGAGTREAQIKQGLSTTGDLLGQLINQKLQEKLGDIAMQGQEVRSQLGANLAARGLNQSSFGAQRVAQSYLAEQADVSQARGRAAKSAANVGSAIDEVTRQIETRRREQTEKMTLSEASTAEDVAFNIDSSALNNRFKQEIAQLELDAQGSGFLGSFLAGIAGGIGGFFVGGPAGAAVGFKAGSAAGGML